MFQGEAPMKSLSPGDRRGVYLVNIYHQGGRVERNVPLPCGRFCPKGKPHIAVRRRGLRLVSPE